MNTRIIILGALLATSGCSGDTAPISNPSPEIETRVIEIPCTAQKLDGGDGRWQLSMTAPVPEGTTVKSVRVWVDTDGMTIDHRPNPTPRYLTLFDTNEEVGELHSKRNTITGDPSEEDNGEPWEYFSPPVDAWLEGATDQRMFIAALGQPETARVVDGVVFLTIEIEDPPDEEE